MFHNNNNIGIIGLGFVEVPINQTLTYPSEVADVSFRCRYEPQALIIWRVNGIQFRGSPQSGIESTIITHDNGSVTEILTIPNNPLYNGTQIACVAYPEGPPEVTPVVILLIILAGRLISKLLMYGYIVIVHVRCHLQLTKLRK